MTVKQKSISLTLGGARSGKTAFAEAGSLARAGEAKPFYLATGQAFDSEMKDRIDRHKKTRPTGLRPSKSRSILPVRSPRSPAG